MTLIKKNKLYNMSVVDVKYLLSLLKSLKKEKNVEVLHLSLQSIIEDLEA